LSRNEGRGVAGEEDRRIGNVVRRTRARDRLKGLEAIGDYTEDPISVGAADSGGLGEDAGDDAARGNIIGADAVLAEFRGR
jgi:hypothetical protein